MILRKTLLTALALAALTVVLLGGCSSGGGTSNVTTGVTGFVVDADSHLGIGNMTVSVGNASGTSRTPQGAFTIAVAPGAHQQVIVYASDLFVPVPGPDVFVDVTAGHVLDLGTLLIIDRNSLPPG